MPEKRSQDDSDHALEGATQGGEAAPPALDIEVDAYSGEDSGLEVDRLRQENAELTRRYTRLAADFENSKRRLRQEKAEVVQYANGELLSRLLPVLDNFERALEEGNASDPDALLKGVGMIHRQIQEVLLQEGLERIPAVGQPFDPSLHEAIGQVESEAPEGTVVSEVRPGYRLRDRVLQPALVAVARRRDDA